MLGFSSVRYGFCDSKGENLGGWCPDAWWKSWGNQWEEVSRRKVKGWIFLPFQRDSQRKMKQIPFWIPDLWRVGNRLESLALPPYPLSFFWLICGIARLLPASRPQFFFLTSEVDDSGKTWLPKSKGEPIHKWPFILDRLGNSFELSNVTWS